MDFNPGKCQVDSFSGPRPIPSVYQLHGLALEVTEHAKYIGVNTSTSLKWNEYIDNICKNAARSLVFR